MRYLIDGYNLLYAMGAVHRRMGPAGLEKARLRLLGLLKGVYGADTAGVTVVFDAAGAPPGARGEEEYQGIHVLYAVRQPEADDLIELLLEHDAAPRALTVVSDDHRLRQAARHRHCLWLGCLDYLDSLRKTRRARRAVSPPAPEKPRAGSGEDRDYWENEFQSLEADPELREFFDLDRFGDDEPPPRA